MLGLLPKGHPHEVLFTWLLFVLSSGEPPTTQQTEMLRLGTGTRREADSVGSAHSPHTCLVPFSVITEQPRLGGGVFNEQKFI